MVAYGPRGKPTSSYFHLYSVQALRSPQWLAFDSQQARRCSPSAGRALAGSILFLEGSSYME